MRGLSPAKYLNGAEFMGDLQEFDIASNYTTAIGNRDPVVISSGAIVRATAGQPFSGSLIGCRYVDANGRFKFNHWWPGSTGCSQIKALVAHNPEILFKIRTATAVGNVTVAYRNAKVNFVLNPVDALGYSTVELGAAGGTTMLVHEILDNTGSELGNPNLNVLAQIIAHTSRPYTIP